MKVQRSIAKSTLSVLCLTFLIKLLGFGKQIVLATLYGATSDTDALYIASSIINALCILIFSSISVTLLSMYTQKLIRDGRIAANALIDKTLCVVLPISAIITIVFFIGAPIAARFFAPTYTGKQLATLTKDIRVMSFSFVLWCYFLTLNVVAETDKLFIPGKGYAFFQNLFIIIAALCFSGTHNANDLIYVYVLAGIIQSVFMTFCVRDKYIPNFKRPAVSQDIKYLLQTAIPLLIGNAVHEINDIVDKQIASSLSDGRVSILTYGASLNEIVTTVIIASFATVLFSHFATWVVENNIDAVDKQLKKSTEYLLMITLPIMVLCMICGDHIVSILYGHGKFTSEDIDTTFGVVAGYAVGFVFQAVRANLVKVYYAFGDAKIPMINGVITVTVNILFSVILSQIFGVSGIAYATSCATGISMVLLLTQIHRYMPKFTIIDSVREYIKMIADTIITTLVVALFHATGISNIWLQFILESCICFGCYMCIAIAMNIKSVKSVIRILYSKIAYKER